MIGRVASMPEFSHHKKETIYYGFKIGADRLSGTTDLLPVVISEFSKNCLSLEVGQLIHIVGQIRTHNFFSELEQRNKLVFKVFAQGIEHVAERDIGMINRVILNGFVCKPPVYRKTPFDREITDLLIAVNRSYRKSDYIPCILWGDNAKRAKRLEVGANISLFGRAQSRIYQKQTDSGGLVDMTAYEISVSEFHVATHDALFSQSQIEDMPGLCRASHDVTCR